MPLKCYCQSASTVALLSHVKKINKNNFGIEEKVRKGNHFTQILILQTSVQPEIIDRKIFRNQSMRASYW